MVPILYCIPLVEVNFTTAKTLLSQSKPAVTEPLPSTEEKGDVVKKAEPLKYVPNYDIRESG